MMLILPSEERSRYQLDISLRIPRKMEIVNAYIAWLMGYLPSRGKSA